LEKLEKKVDESGKRSIRTEKFELLVSDFRDKSWIDLKFLR